ncbi:MAG: class I SAM-dependent methyltransferase, partial [Dehalococcoidia bacterium]
LTARLAMREHHIKRRIIARARLAPGQRLLDVGCGTGTLALLAERAHPLVTVVGVDGDPTILRLARRKAAKAGKAIQFDEGMAYALPYTDGSFDAVVSSLVFHHLTPDQQERALDEVMRVLHPGGRLVVADFAPPHNRAMRLVRRVSQTLLGRHGGGHAPRHAPATARFDRRLAARGWAGIAAPEHFMTLMGTLTVYAAVRPGTGE